MNDIDDCEIHGCATVLAQLRVGDPMRVSLKGTAAYLWARRAQFPHSDDVVAGQGIRRATKTAKMPVCMECCKQRDQFLLTNYPLWASTHELAG